MQIGTRGRRSDRIGRRGAKRLKVEILEGRALLAIIDLGGVTPPSSPVATSPLPNIATVPYGIAMAGGQSSGGAGWSVTDVGDVNGDGFDDFVIGSPTVVNSGGQVTLGTGHNSTAYLVFGSNQVNTGTVDWLTLNNPIQRVGDLAQLGNTPGFQTNPINGQPGFAFNGIKFITSQETSSQLGASVAALGTIGGQRAFVLGAPGGTINGSNTVQGGRAFVIYGGANLNNLSGQTIDLDNLQTNQGINFIAFVTNATGAQIGASVAGPGDVLDDATNDVAIGAPGATYNGNANAGVAFLIDGIALPVPNGPATILVDGVGQTGGTRGVVFGGVHAGDQTGASLAGAGDINGAITTANTRVGDFLIGAPGASTAYLVYGGSALVGDQSDVGGLNSIDLSRLGAAGTAPNTVVGATFAGQPGDGTGFAVATAGDFNADGLDDFMIGSPFFRGNEGRVSLFYGQAAASNHLFGTISLDNIPTSNPAIQYTGAAAGALAGWSISDVGRINLNENANPILIGSPGFAGNTGAAYLIPGNSSTPVGTFSLTDASAQPVAATVLTLTTPGGPSAPFFGASVSGRLTQSGQTSTADADLIGDFIIGAPGYAATGSRALDGGAMIVQGAIVPTQTPTTPITFTTTTLPNATVGGAYSQQIATSGGTSPITFAVTTGSLPNGLSLSSTGLLSGTPTAAGASDFTVTATDNTGATATQAYTLVVNPVSTFTISPTTLPNGTVNAAYNEQLSTTGGSGTVTFAVTTGTLPNGLSLSSAGLISGTPTAAGTSDFTVTATGSAGATATQAYVLVVNPATTTGPTVTNLQRFGFHAQPTTFVLTFSAAMNPGPAQNVNNYTLVRVANGSPGTPIPLSSAVYDATNNTVTLTPINNVYLFAQYRLTVNGAAPSGLTDTAGHFLAGANGQAGTNFVQTFGQEILTGPHTPSSTPAAVANFISTEWTHTLAPNRALLATAHHVPIRATRSHAVHRVTVHPKTPAAAAPVSVHNMHHAAFDAALKSVASMHVRGKR